MKLRNNVKLVHGTVILIVIAFLSLVLIGVVSFGTTAKLNKNFKSISTESVNSIQLYGELAADFNDIKYVATKIIDRPYSEDTAVEGESIFNSLQATTTKLSEREMDAEERQALEAIKVNNQESYEIYNNIKNAKKNSTALSMQELAVFQQNGIENTEIIAKMAKEINEETNSQIQQFNKSINTFKTIIAVVVVGAVALLLLVSIVFIRELKLIFEDMISTIDSIAEGDFTSGNFDAEIAMASGTEFGKMNVQLDNMKKSLSNLLKDIKNVACVVGDQSSNLLAVSEEMSATSQEVSLAVNEVATGSSTQSAELMSINNSIKEFGEIMQRFAGLTSGVNNTAGSIGEMANSSNTQLEGLMTSFNNINESFEEVINKIRMLEDRINQANEITGLINNISAQTNLLALNAAIEAARAGEAGRGFSVVADEIRKLADQSRTSSEKISELLGMVSSETSNLVNTTGNVSDELTNEVATINASIVSFKAIVDSVENILPDIDRVTVGMNKLNEGILPVLLKIEGTSAVSEENSASAEEIAASSDEMSRSAGSVSSTAQSLSNSANKLTEGLEKFKL